MEPLPEGWTDGLLLSERIRRAISDDVTSGRLAPGTQLDEQEIGRRFGVSRTPVREALRELASAGLIEVRPRRGAVVCGFTRQEIVDLFELSAETEAMCVRLAAFRMDPLERSQLKKLHEQSQDVVERGDVNAYDAFNLKFHETIYHGTHNAAIADQAIKLRSRMVGYRRTQLFEHGRPQRSRHEHDGILEAIMEGDGDTAARRMRAHMLNASFALESYIERAANPHAV